MVKLNPVPTLKARAESFVYGVMSKYGNAPMGQQRRNKRNDGQEPPYERNVSPEWLKNMAENHAIINNSIEEKVQQSFRRGFSPIEKLYEAKCPECQEQFGSLAPFKLDDSLRDDEVDLDTKRPCPECDEIVEMKTPDQDMKDVIEEHFKTANMRSPTDLEPERMSSISQTFLEVCREVAWDIQIFDDGWMTFERSYTLEQDGSVWDWELEEVFRAPAQLMRYSTNDEGKIGGEFWVCMECRAKDEDYKPQKNPGPCQKCDNRTYEVFAYMLDDVHGDPVQYYTRGEFAHASEYRPRFTYGYSPVLSLWQEARTLEQMDEWYQKAYEERRAPRGAIVVRSSNAESVRAWNTEQMQKLNADNQHIPTFIDDTEGSGDPLKWQPLLEEPAQMQHMQMREWFLDRISAKFGVTAVFQKGAASSSGMSQSLEIVVANRSMERLQSVFDDYFLPAMMGQLQADGWTRTVRSPEEEDEQAEAQLEGRHLNNLQVAQQLGLEAEWTEDDRANVKAGPIEEMEDDGMAGGLGAMMGGDEPSGEGSGQTSPSGGRPDEAEEMGGAPDSPDDPSTDNPFNRADNAVSSGDGGYSNTAYSGEDDPEVINYLEQVQEQLDDAPDAQKRDKLVESALERYHEENIGPDEESLRKAHSRPDKGFQYVRRRYSGDWCQDYNKNYTVRLMYNIISHEQ